MQQARPLHSDTTKAAGVIAVRRLVGWDGAQATVQGQKCKGVAEQPAAAAGAYIPVTMVGTAIVECGAAVAVGATLISDAQGRAITANAVAVAAGAVAVTSVAANGATDIVGSDLPEHAVGTAMEAGAGAGSFIEIYVNLR